MSHVVVRGGPFKGLRPHAAEDESVEPRDILEVRGGVQRIPNREPERHVMVWKREKPPRPSNPRQKWEAEMEHLFRKIDKTSEDEARLVKLDHLLSVYGSR